MCVLVYVCTSPGQTKNNTDLKFDTHTPIDLIEKRVFCFFEKITVTAAILEKLPCHTDFPRISSIALLSLYFQENCNIPTYKKSHDENQRRKCYYAFSISLIPTYTYKIKLVCYLTTRQSRLYAEIRVTKKFFVANGF